MLKKIESHQRFHLRIYGADEIVHHPIVISIPSNNLTREKSSSSNNSATKHNKGAFLSQFFLQFFFRGAMHLARKLNKKILINKTENFSVYKHTKNWLNFGCILTEFWLHYDCILTEFWLRFDWILAAFWLHFGWTLTEFRLNFDWILTEFWLSFDWILIEFWLNFDWMSTEFWLNFDWNLIELWLHFDSILAVFDCFWLNFKKMTRKLF